MKALMKQAMVEALADNDTDVDRGLLFEQLRHLNFTEWSRLMDQCMKHLTVLLNRVRAIHDVLSVAIINSCHRPEEVAMIADDDRQRLQQSLKEMVQSICDSAHEQCGRLLSSRTKDGALLERVTSQEFVDLAQLIESFVVECEKISGHKARAMRLAFQVTDPHLHLHHRFSSNSLP